MAGAVVGDDVLVRNGDSADGPGVAQRERERTRVVHVRDGDGYLLRVAAAAAVGGGDRDLVDVVRVRVAGRLEVGRRGEAEDAARLVDREVGIVGSAPERVGERVAVRICRVDVRDGGLVLGHRLRGRRPAAVRADRRILVGSLDHVRDGDGYLLRVAAAAAVGGGDRDLVDVVRVRVAG